MTMVGRTLSGYLANRFTRWILGVLVVGAVLIFVVDFFELVRRAGERDGFSVGRALAMSLLRTPSLSERLWPFAALFGSIGAFVGLARRSELVVIRSAGVSVWQFLMPPVAVAIVLGIAVTTVLNPAGAWLRQKADELGVVLLGREQILVTQTAKDLWLRQRGVDGDTIIHARQTREQGLELFGVTVFSFDQEGGFQERIEADSARLEPDHWNLANATVYTPDAEPHHHDSFLVATDLKPAEILETLGQADAVSFWRLPALIDRAARAGLSVYPYRLQFQSLIALPLLLGAMVLIAATVSLRGARFGGTGRLVASGVAAGFVLYVATEVARDLGGVGLVPPSISAWSPGVVAALLGATILLNLEDG
jgi:lipopolysaccharide export system permease protein